jgi:hypothetical protein
MNYFLFCRAEIRAASWGVNGGENPRKDGGER